MRDRQIKLIIEGDPIAKMRARLRMGFHYQRFYDSQSQDKLIHKMIVVNQFGRAPMFEGPCFMDVTFFMPIRKSHIVPENSYHFYKPDTDNLLKWTLDLLQTVTYKNDCIVCDIAMRKLYSLRPRTEIILKELDYEYIYE